METIMKVSFLKIYLKDKENSFLKMVDIYKENGKILSWKEKEYKFLMMVDITKENSKMEKFTVMENALTNTAIL
jgi:hypothetical protein